MTADYLLAAGRRNPLFRADPGAARCRKSLRTELQVSRAKRLRPPRDDHNQQLTARSACQTTREEETLRAAAKTKMAATFLQLEEIMRAAERSREEQ